MATELIINKDDYETRVALLENGQLTEIFIERKSDSPRHGNIYKGKVMQILPGIQASFIDIGCEKSAFLYAGDFYDIDASDYDFFEPGSEELPLSELNNNGGNALNAAAPEHRKSKKKKKGLPNIDQLLKKNQEILVQIAKEPVKTKGARITSHISLPGRFLVYMPTSSSIGISRKIKSDEEKKRLKNIVLKYRSEGTGFIIRTAAENASEADIEGDIKFLIALWNNIYRSQLKTKAPRLIFQDIGISLRALRDLLNKTINKIVVDDKEEYEKIAEFLTIQSPEYVNIIEFYTDSLPVFEHFNIEKEISKALNKKVWLKSGGYIVIDHAEALTAIDVNTGKYVGKKNFEDTILKTNLEAAKEIAYQLRLRNIGGIIVIDFIDMVKGSHKEKVYRTLEDALKNDRVKTTINKITELGLVEMTRKRTGNSLAATFLEQCPMCEGQGSIKSPQTICFEIFRAVSSYAKKTVSKKITVTVHSYIMNKLYEYEKELEKLEARVNKKITIKMQDSFYPEYFEIS
ncbi:MAG: Rne/Rng family ribonuclease [Deltaproteobacteria bacterium]|nr:Rne/Rng family ribonuclease [Deltaproteobacteria bacterium]